MERFPQKRFTITSIADRSSSGRSSPLERAERGGNRQVAKQRNLPKLPSDSSSCSSGTTNEDLFIFQLGRRSSKQASGTQMKNLLAEEMTKETESKMRSPTIIGKLMGLDGLPPQQSSYKPPKRLSDDHLKRNSSLKKDQRSGPICAGRSSRRSSKEQQEFKDVFEVLDTSNTMSNCYSSQENAKSKLTEAEMAFVRQKFIDAKRLSTDEKLQNSEEFLDALEVLDSNKDLLLKYFQQPDSLITNRANGLEGAVSHSNCGFQAAKGSAENQKYVNNDRGLKSKRETLWKNNVKSPQKHCIDSSSHSDSDHGSHYTDTSSNIQLEGKQKLANIPTRIVILKPNLGKMQSDTNLVSSPCSSGVLHSDCTKHTESQNMKNMDAELPGKKNFHSVAGLTRKSGGSTLYKEFNRPVSSLYTHSMTLSSLGFQGPSGGESSYRLSGNEFVDELEVEAVSLRSSFNLNSQCMPSPSRCKESSVSKEAKRRLSERWKIAHNSRDKGAVSRGSTLAEMLAVPDKGVMPARVNARSKEHKCTKKFPTDNAPAGWVEPLGISSRDGWKDASIAKLSRQRSLPSSATGLGNFKPRHIPDNFCNDRYMTPKEALKRERNKAVKCNSDKRDKNSRSRNKKSHFAVCTDLESIDTLLVHSDQNQVKANLLENDPSEKSRVVLETMSFSVQDNYPGPQNVIDVRHEKRTMDSEPADELLPELPTTTAKCDSCSCDQNTSMVEEPSVGLSQDSSVPFQDPLDGIKYPARSNETEQPSPVSVLEPPFTDNLSSCSECFETLTADLHGLRMQLQLLKLESEVSAEGSMLISSYDDVGEESIGFADDKGLLRDKESLELSYIFDVLIVSGLDNADPDNITATWSSPDFPINPLVFDELENKQNDPSARPRSERKLLFDRINYGILEIYQPFTDSHPWVSPTTIQVDPKWIRGSLRDGLCKLISSQETKLLNESIENLLVRESQWLNLGDEIDVIGREIEKLLIDELVEEVVEV